MLRIAVVAAFVVSLASAALPAETVPDFSSATAGWNTPVAGQFLPVEGAPGPVQSDPKYPFYSNVEAAQRGVQIIYRIADLTNPNLKPGVKEKMKKDIDEVLAGKIAYTPSTSCEPAGVPAYDLQPGALYFVQTPKQVLIVNSFDSQVRQVYLQPEHSADVKPSWYGESIGHYEGDELVVDTIGLNTKTFADAYRTPHSEKLHVVERWKLTDSGKGLQVTMTVDDPETFNQPWQAMVRYRKGNTPVMEAICAENNLQFDYHMPVATKPDF